MRFGAALHHTDTSRRLAACQYPVVALSAAGGAVTISNRTNRFAAWLEQDMRDRQLGVREYAKFLGVDHSLLSRYLNNALYPTRKTVQRIAAALNVPQSEIDALLPSERTSPRGEQDAALAEITKSLADIRAAIAPTSSRIISIPIHGAPASTGSTTTHVDHVQFAVPPEFVNHRFEAVEVRGDCLEPSGIAHGHIAIVDLDIRERHGDLVLARRDDELLVKRLEIDGRLRWLIADQHWEPLLVADGVEVIGVVKWFQFAAPYTRLPR